MYIIYILNIYINNEKFNADKLKHMIKIVIQIITSIKLSVQKIH